MTAGKKYSIETAFKMYNDITGAKIVVETDAYTSELVAIKQYDSSGTLDGTILLSPEEIPLVIEMLSKMFASPVKEYLL